MLEIYLALCFKSLNCSCLPTFESFRKYFLPQFLRHTALLQFLRDTGLLQFLRDTALFSFNVLRGKLARGHLFDRGRILTAVDPVLQV